MTPIYDVINELYIVLCGFGMIMTCILQLGFINFIERRMLRLCLKSFYNKPLRVRTINLRTYDSCSRVNSQAK